MRTPLILGGLALAGVVAFTVAQQAKEGSRVDEVKRQRRAEEQRRRDEIELLEGEARQQRELALQIFLEEEELLLFLIEEEEKEYRRQEEEYRRQEEEFRRQGEEALRDQEEQIRQEEERLAEEEQIREAAAAKAERERAVEEVRQAEEERQRQAMEVERARVAEEIREREEYEREQAAIRQAEINERQRAQELLLRQQEEDARIAEVARQRKAEERAREAEEKAEAQRLQELFWKQEKDERQRLLALEDARIAEEKARLPVIVPYGNPRVDPNIAIATGGAKDIMEVGWGYDYISGPPHLFITLKVIYRGGRTDQQPIGSAAVPGQRRPLILHRFGAGIYQPGTHSVTLQLISTPTDRNVWTVHAEETISFTIPEPPFYRRNLDDVANELGWGVYRQGKSYNWYRDKMYAYFAGNNTRVQDRWIREWYDGATKGVIGKWKREGVLGHDRQKALTAP